MLAFMGCLGMKEVRFYFILSNCGYMPEEEASGINNFMPV
jgi:hypothetical protein